MRKSVKLIANIIALCLTAIPGLICWIEAKADDHKEGHFAFWSQFFAMLPGYPGIYLRRAFYRLTLDYCAGNCFIGFGTLFSHRQSIVEESVFIGSYSLIGSAKIGKSALVGSRVSIVNSDLHQLDEEGHWTPSDFSKLRQVVIGQNTWIGEASTIMADVGDGSLVASASVVSKPVPTGIVVAGNPARFVRHLKSDPAYQKSSAVL